MRYVFPWARILFHPQQKIKLHVISFFLHDKSIISIRFIKKRLPFKTHYLFIFAHFIRFLFSFPFNTPTPKLTLITLKTTIVKCLYGSSQQPNDTSTSIKNQLAYNQSILQYMIWLDLKCSPITKRCCHCKHNITIYPKCEKKNYNIAWSFPCRYPSSSTCLYVCTSDQLTYINDSR